MRDRSSLEDRQRGHPCRAVRSQPPEQAEGGQDQMSTERLAPGEPNPRALESKPSLPNMPPLDWGPFGVGITMCLIFVALTVVIPLVAGLSWWLLCWIATIS